MNTTKCASLSVSSDGDYKQLKEFVIGATGLAYYWERDEEFVHRLNVRLGELGITEFWEYLKILKDAEQGEAELDLLIEHLTIGETHFFRHQEVFNSLCNFVAPALFREKRSRSIRIWSAGCSSGAEAYSVGITLLREVNYDRSRWDVSILGTDINRRALQQATRAEYSEWDLRGVGEEHRNDCFIRKDKKWIVRPEYRRGVSFQYYNLVRHPFPSLENNILGFDIIFCRNVLMYFDRPTSARIIDQLHDCLVEGGWLLVGHADPNLELFAAFQTVRAPGAILYRKFGPSQAKADGKQQCIAPDYVPWKFNIPPRECPPRECESRTSDATIVTKDNEELLARIRTLADEGDLAEAERLCRQWLDACPLEGSPYYYLALMLDQEGISDGALELLRKVIYLEPHMAMGHYHLGLIFQRLGDPNRSTQAYLNCRRLLPHGEHELVPFSDGIEAEDFRKLVDAQMATVPQEEVLHGH